MAELTAEELAAYADDAAPKPEEAANILAQITNVVRELKEARADAADQEEVLKAANKRVQVLEEVTLPTLMDEAKQLKLRTLDGDDVERVETLRASIPVARQAEAFKWLVEHGQAAIIKRQLGLEFGKGEDEKAKAALKLILEAGFNPTDKQSVHAMTLQATIREMLDEGVEVPMDLLGAYIQPKVKVKEPKKK